MRLLFLGDVVGKPGRDALAKYLPRLQRKLELDFTVVNGENAAHGIGITSQICHEFFDLGVDCITTGNHIWDQKEIIPHMQEGLPLVRPANYPDAPGKGALIRDNVLIINLMGRVFMPPLDCPFRAADRLAIRGTGRQAPLDICQYSRFHQQRCRLPRTTLG